MKLLRKTHIWKDIKTFFEIESINPENEKNYTKQGNILFKIGQQHAIKSAFKLNPDEARAVRDVLDIFLRFHDMEMSKLMTNLSKEYSQKYSEGRSSITTENTPNSVIQNTNPNSQQYKQKGYPYVDPFEKKEEQKISEAYEPDNESIFGPSQNDYSNESDSSQVNSFNNEEEEKEEDKEKYNTEFYF